VDPALPGGGECLTGGETGIMKNGGGLDRAEPLEAVAQAVQGSGCDGECWH
jgi:hypothetical protein